MGEEAFPHGVFDGMTKREYYAAHAPAAWDEGSILGIFILADIKAAIIAGRWAYADAMIAEGEK